MTDPTIQLTPVPPGDLERDDSDRLMRIVLAILAAAAIALILLLIFLLKPGGIFRGAQPKDCPMTGVRSLYGYGTNGGELLRYPLAAAFDEDNNVWVSDTGNSRVVVLTRTGRLVKIVGAKEGRGQLSNPNGIAIDTRRRRAYIADWANRAVLVYSTQGRYLERLPAPGQENVFGKDGFTPYDVRLVRGRVVAASNDGLYFFDRAGKVTTIWGGERGAAPGQFNFPNAFGVDEKSGRIYVADTLNRRVVALDPEGKILWASGRPDQTGKIAGFWQLPRSVTVAPDGKRIYVVDTFRAQAKCGGVGHVVVLDPDGNLVSEFGSSGPSESSFSFPEKLAISPKGQFALADRENHRVMLFGTSDLPPPSKAEAATYRDSFISGGELGSQTVATRSPTGQ